MQLPKRGHWSILHYWVNEGLKDDQSGLRLSFVSSYQIGNERCASPQHEQHIRFVSSINLSENVGMLDTSLLVTRIFVQSSKCFLQATVEISTPFEFA